MGQMSATNLTCTWKPTTEWLNDMVKCRFAPQNSDQLANRAMDPLVFGFMMPFECAAMEEATRIVNDANNLTTADVKGPHKGNFVILVDCKGLVTLINHCGATGVTLFPNDSHCTLVLAIARILAQQCKMLHPTCTQAT